MALARQTGAKRQPRMEGKNISVKTLRRRLAWT